MTQTTFATSSAHDAVPDGITWPGPDTLVLLKRPLLPEADLDRLSRFGDDRWSLTEAVFEDNASTVILNFTLVPASWRLDVKHFVWQLLNNDEHAGGWPATRTVRSVLFYLRPLIGWLNQHQVTSFAQVTPEMLDDYLIWLGGSGRNVKQIIKCVAEVRRLWSYRAELPPRMRLPAAEPWDGEAASDLLGRTAQRGENRIPRIQEQTMQPLLVWAIRFVEDFADDIITAWHEHRVLARRTPGRNRKGTVHAPGGVRPKAEAWLDRLRADGEALPGRLNDDGAVEIDWYHLARIMDCSLGLKYNSTGDLIRASGLPVMAPALLDAPVNGLLDGRPWRTNRIGFYEARALVRHLSAACLVIVSYLSGARCGEVLSLRRGCVEHDPVTGLWLVRGRHWKGAKDAKGNKVAEGLIRQAPWVVVEIVADAVAVLERLHEDDLLFPAQLARQDTTSGRGKAMADKAAPVTIAKFVAWVNDYCEQNGRRDSIKPDGSLYLSRFRRTLAWFIRRKPRGLVAASLQYGHVETMITQGYAGSYDSGFPDDYAFEDWLARMEQVVEDEQRLGDGEHVSGPAAGAYRQRVHAAAGEFGGMVVPRIERVKTLLSDPRLQIFHGEGMTCVFNPATALCQLRPALGDPQSTPDIDDCRPRCPNLALTDRDIEHVQARITQLEEIVADPLAPPIRHQRDMHELERLQTIVGNHQAGTDDGDR